MSIIAFCRKCTKLEKSQTSDRVWHITQLLKLSTFAKYYTGKSMHISHRIFSEHVNAISYRNQESMRNEVEAEEIEFGSDP